MEPKSRYSTRSIVVDGTFQTHQHFTRLGPFHEPFIDQLRIIHDNTFYMKQDSSFTYKKLMCDQPKQIRYTYKILHIQIVSLYVSREVQTPKV